jgi:hypothetical protein
MEVVAALRELYANFGILHATIYQASSSQVAFLYSFQLAVKGAHQVLAPFRYAIGGNLSLSPIFALNSWESLDANNVVKDTALFRRSRSPFKATKSSLDKPCTVASMVLFSCGNLTFTNANLNSF